jgi:hypothetical protein
MGELVSMLITAASAQLLEESRLPWRMPRSYPIMVAAIQVVHYGGANESQVWRKGLALLP